MPPIGALSEGLLDSSGHQGGQGGRQAARRLVRPATEPPPGRELLALQRALPALEHLIGVEH